MGEQICEQALLRSLLIKEDIQTVFQPIFDVANTKVVGYEALARGPEDHPLQYPNELFSVAETFGLLSELELLCRKLAIKRFAEKGLQGYLFINVSPQTIEQHGHPHGETLNLVKQYGLKPHQIVIEITETFESKDPDLLKSSLQHYRNFGFKIAIDDLGTGHSGLKQWAELRPDVVKIDRYFISDCHENIVKRELLRTMFELGRATGVDIIAEGIEKNEEYLVLTNLGMKYAQGFLLAKPDSQPKVSFPQELLVAQTSQIEDSVNKDFSELEIGNLVEQVAPIAANMTCLEVYKVFKSSQSLQSLAVVNAQQKPIGMVHRDQLAELFSSDFGHALYDKKPIESVMTDISLKVDISTPIDEVSSRITDDEYFDQKPEFIVTNLGKYLGLASVRSLLKKMTEEKIKNAQHANPLTMLPGNLVIQQKLNNLLRRKQSFQMAYFDLDHFKPFNDLYGYAAGDTVIKLVSEVLTQACEDNFIGHVGGDDFVVIFLRSDAEEICSLALSMFESRIMNCFDAKHVAENGYYAQSREGERQFYPLLSLSCGIITTNADDGVSHYDISQLASEAKKQAKNMPKGQVYSLAS